MWLLCYLLLSDNLLLRCLSGSLSSRLWLLIYRLRFWLCWSCGNLRLSLNLFNWCRTSLLLLWLSLLSSCLLRLLLGSSLLLLNHSYLLIGLLSITLIDRLSLLSHLLLTLNGLDRRLDLLISGLNLCISLWLITIFSDDFVTCWYFRSSWNHHSTIGISLNLCYLLSLLSCWLRCRICLWNSNWLRSRLLGNSNWLCNWLFNWLNNWLLNRLRCWYG